MKFAIQNTNKENNPLFVQPDFINLLIQSKEYYQWWNPSIEFEIVFVESYQDLESPEDYCPIGSVEFCVDWYSYVHCVTLYPYNVPDSFSFTNNNLPIFINEQNIHNVTVSSTDDLLDFLIRQYDYCKDMSFYIKSNDIIKYSKNGLYNFKDLKLLDDNKIFEHEKTHSFQIRPRMRILGEYRIFIYKSQIIDIKQYSGDIFTPKPQEDRIKEIIKIFEKYEFNEYGEVPCSYTLDIGITDFYTQHVQIIEFHDFFSCGLYGFNDLFIYPQMLYDVFKQTTTQTIMDNEETT